MTQEQVTKAKTLLRLQNTPRFADPAFALAVAARYSKVPDDVREIAEREFANDPQLNEPIRRSRRLDLEAEYERRRQENPDETPPLFVKVLIAGSGYNGWATQVETDGGVSLGWDREDDVTDETESTRYRKDKDGKSDLMFAGPGGSTTKGGSYFGGASDTGSNSIEALVANVPPLIGQAIVTGLEGDEDRPVIVLIKAHSRGAVAASRIAKIVKADHPGTQVELTQVDPVPGPDQAGENLEIDLGEDEGAPDESTLVYSVASGYPVGFTPQKVHGAKRILISRQSHSVGLKNGFVYAGHLYKGSSLNSLSEGVYVDMNADGENKVPLVRVADIATARVAIKEAYDKSAAWTGDTDRLDIIGQVLTEFLNQA